MKRAFGFLALAAVLAASAFSPAADAPKLVFKTGAKLTPAHVIASSPKFTKSGKLGAPLQFAAVPKRLSMWGNNRYGCCVTSEECAAKIADHPNAFITEDTCIRWASSHGVLNGADLGSVLKMMERDGIVAEDGTVYKDGSAATVDYNDKAALEQAIYTGRVKIAVASDQIMNSVNQTRGQSGWAGVNWRRDQEIDHCVGLFGYGPAKFCYEQLGKPLPANVSPDTPGYLMFTWNSIGFVDRPSLMNVIAEAWVRNPTTAGYPQPPEPPPAPPAPPTPPAPKPAPTPEPAPEPKLPIWWILAGEGFVILAVVAGIVFVGRRSAAK
jgi:hypothetical protein